MRLLLVGDSVTHGSTGDWTWRYRLWHHLRACGLAAELSTAASRVVVARTAAGFEQLVDTYDAVHPSARGEVRIVAGVADALAELGIGMPYPRPPPDPSAS